jgi:AraC-like DNA-binding protein
MSLLQQYLFVIGAFQGLLLAALLPLGDKVRNANKILAFWCVLLALRFVWPFITLEKALNPFTWLLGFDSFLPACFGGLLYLYCRHAMIDRPLRWLDALHFVPMLICYALNFDVLLLSAEQKLSMVVNSQGPSGWNREVGWFILYVQAFVYIGLSARLIYHCQTRAQETLAGFHPGIFTWLWVIVGFNFFIWGLKVLAKFGIFWQFSYLFSEFLIVLWIYSIAMFQWRDPKLFRIEQLVDEEDEKPVETQSTSEGALNDDLRGQLLTALRAQMTEQQLFLDNQLTLTRLSEAVGISAHHLSEVLNQKEGKNFYQFVNQYRVDFVCRQLKQDPALKILDLALSAGFASKSTFNAVFKQLTGTTPSQYRQSLKSTP